MSLQIGVGLPTVGRGPQLSELGDVLAAGRLAEELGLESVWAADHLMPPAALLDSTMSLAAVAGATQRVHLGFSVLVLALRRLAWAAKQLGTLQHLSGGRVLLGVGIGGEPNGLAGWDAAGVPFGERAHRTDAGLRALPPLLAGETVTLDHEPGSPEVRLTPSAPVPPVLIGGNGDAALRRTAAFGDAWFPSAISPHNLATGSAKLRALAAEHGRPCPTVTVGVPAALDSDDTTHAALVERLAGGYGVPREEAEQIPLTGTPAESAERLAEYEAAGAERVVLMSFGSDWRRHYEQAAGLATIE
jgi:alkanesulfonate monooxygenase SsuD/methylene tetrahydromethanopterin reductase-like flavin-dependent oxidoreductase (luciferase family)